ncbi:MAG: hypothetical protein ACLQT6_05125, partial [Desulfomonilaceae bacterium]
AHRGDLGSRDRRSGGTRHRRVRGAAADYAGELGAHHDSDGDGRRYTETDVLKRLALKWRFTIIKIVQFFD